MKTLLFRGHQSSKIKKEKDKRFIKLSYKSRIYKQKRNLDLPFEPELKYRGKKYFSKKLLSSSTIEKKQKIYLLAKSIAHYQFNLAHEELSQRLWDEVAKHDIDPERIINILYGCESHKNIESMIECDFSYLAKKNKD